MPVPAFLLAPGAGAPSSHPRMRTFARLLESIGPVEPFDYPYALEGRRRPDPLPKLIEAHRAALAALRLRHGGPIVLAGKSMGGRVGCHVALVEKVEALICFGYPLCGGGDRSKLRDQVLLELTTPILFLQGTRDPLCPLELLDDVRKRMRALSTLHVVDGGDHSLLLAKATLKATGSTQEDADEGVRSAIAGFLKDALAMAASPLHRPSDGPPPPLREGG
ncbi:MAG TPA: alpha/beta family hydrolase [Roseiarcus sp.]|nr:alpha/beta family hydrolase [Roseiarcus sp.]